MLVLLILPDKEVLGPIKENCGPAYNTYLLSPILAEHSQKHMTKICKTSFLWVHDNIR